MEESWIDIYCGGESRRHPLQPGRTRVGGKDCDVDLGEAFEGHPEAELHLWTGPPRVVYVGRGEPPRIEGRAFEEALLQNGVSIQWRGVVLVYGRAPVLEEILDEDSREPSPEAPATKVEPGAGVGWDRAAARLEARVRAGLLADLNLTDGGATKRWRNAVLLSEFDEDACARELLAGAKVGPDDPRLLQRAGRLERDLLMSAHMRGLRGVRRRARSATRSGLAYVVANLVAISVYTLVVLAVLLLVRVQYGTSVDAALDGVLSTFERAVGNPGEAPTPDR